MYPYARLWFNNFTTKEDECWKEKQCFVKDERLAGFLKFEDTQNQHSKLKSDFITIILENMMTHKFLRVEPIDKQEFIRCETYKENFK